MSEEALQIAEKRREVKGKPEKERYTHLNAEFQRIARRDKAFLSDQCKEIEENNRMGKTGEGNGTPLQYSCLENPRCRGPALADPGYLKKRQHRRPIYLFIQRYKE